MYLYKVQEGHLPFFDELNTTPPHEFSQYSIMNKIKPDQCMTYKDNLMPPYEHFHDLECEQFAITRVYIGERELM